SLTSQLDAVLEELAPEIDDGRARVEVQRPLPTVKGNSHIIYQILLNLIGNALKFVPQGRTPDVRIRAERMPAAVRLWVEDNGIGISPEYQQRIFRVFERLHSQNEYPGTGMGLAIVQKGVERMNGRAGVESEPGAGSRFWIELPASD
ncbi:MAG: sensor histidine kinase, partial [Verrucomicrobiota bacterium]